MVQEAVYFLERDNPFGFSNNILSHGFDHRFPIGGPQKHALRARGFSEQLSAIKSY